MTTTMANLRIGLLKAADDYISGTVTTGTSSTVFIDTSLANYAPRPPAVYDWVYWLSATQSANVGLSRRIAASGYNATTYQVTMASALTGTTTIGDTYEISHLKPADVLDAINQARIELYPYLSQYLEKDLLFTEQNRRRYTIPSTINTVYGVKLLNEVSTDIDENILDDEALNPDFEEWTSTSPDHWTASNITTTYNTDDDFVWDDDYSCECLCAASSTCTLTNTITNYSYYSGMSMSFSIMAYCMTGSRLRASIYDGTTTTYSSYHGGSGWEKLTVTATMQATPTAVSVGIQCASGTVLTVYLDNAILTMGTRATETGGDPIFNWKQIGSVLELPYEPAMNQIIRVTGTGYLTVMATDASAMEIDEKNTPLLYAQAMVILFSRQRKTNQNTEHVDSQIAFWMSKVAQYKKSMTMVIPPYENGCPDWHGG
jgi:hypothetical protein